MCNVPVICLSGQPLPESVELVEEIVVDYVTEMVRLYVYVPS